MIVKLIVMLIVVVTELLLAVLIYIPLDIYAYLRREF